MAIDSALLALAESDGVGFLRVYRWAPACISFGRHEAALRALRPRADRRARRGHGAPAHRWAGGLARRRADLCGGRAARRARLAPGELRADPCDACGCAPAPGRGCDACARARLAPASPDAGACFETAAGGELLVGGRKVAGSAQLRTDRALLQHGSLLLGDDQRRLAALVARAAPRVERGAARAAARPRRALRRCRGRGRARRPPLEGGLARRGPRRADPRARRGVRGRLPLRRLDLVPLSAPATVPVHCCCLSLEAPGATGAYVIARRVAPVCAVVCALAAGHASAQARPPGTVVIVTGQYPSSPVPTAMEGAQSTTANQELSDQLFLRLANLGPDRRTADERSFQPALARRWERLDSLTLAIELDSARALARRPSGRRQRRRVHLRPRAQPEARAEARQPAPPSRRGDCGRGAACRVPVQPSVPRAVLRHRLPCVAAPVPSARRADRGDSARVHRQPGGKRTVSRHPRGAGPVRGADRESGLPLRAADGLPGARSASRATPKRG